VTLTLFSSRFIAKTVGSRDQIKDKKGQNRGLSIALLLANCLRRISELIFVSGLKWEMKSEFC